jgi:hypothetical protein
MPLDFDIFYYFAEDLHERILLTNSRGTLAKSLMLYIINQTGDSDSKLLI